MDVNFSSSGGGEPGLLQQPNEFFSMSSKIGIITVNLNSGSRLLETVRSLENQTMRPEIHIIKDGCSNDNSVELIENYLARPEVLLVVEKDKSIYDGMNQALKHIRCEYVYFLNAGDKLLGKTGIETISSHLENHQFSTDIVYFNYFNEETNVVSNFPKKLSAYYLYRRGGICHQAYLMKSCLLKKFGGFDPSWEVSAEKDTFFKIRSTKNLKTIRINEILSVYEGSGISKNLNMAKSIQYRNTWRKKYFSKKQRILFGMLSFITLEGIRYNLFKKQTKLYMKLKRILLIG